MKIITGSFTYVKNSSVNNCNYNMVSLGFSPKAVLIMPQYEKVTSATSGISPRKLLLIPNSLTYLLYYYNSTSTTAALGYISQDGFVLPYNSTASNFWDSTGANTLIFNYIAFGDDD